MSRSFLHFEEGFDVVFGKSLVWVNTNKLKEFVNKKLQFSGKTMNFQIMQ